MDENILLWEEDEVLEFLSALGYPGYSDQIRAEGITGELLIHCNHEALKDIGIHSVGHRLAILKAVYQLKLQWDVPVEEGHWVPPSEGMDQIMVDSPSGVIPPDRMLELLRERDERILSLEMSISRLQEHMTGVRDEVHVISKTLYTKDGPPVSLNRLRGQPSPTQHTFPHPLSNSSIASSAGGAASAAPNGVPASSVALKHMRSGSLSASASGSGHSPQLSPVNSPTRYQHTLGALQQDESGSALSSAAPAGSGSAGLQHSSSLRRQRSQNRHAPSPAPAHAHASEQHAASSSPAPSPLPSSMLLGTNGSHEPSTPTAYQGLPVSSAGDTTPSIQHHPPHQYASAHMQHSPAQAQIPAAGFSAPASAELPISGSSTGKSARPSTGALSTSPSGAAGTSSGFSSSSLLSDRPATASTSASLMVGHSRDGTAASTGSSSRDGRPSTSTSTTASKSGPGSGSGSSADNPLKSFRVTFNDPCWKVLPAALKKYKINDDWRQYALFICYGTVERCLAYDEKPLLLFQKLTETNQKPVFMLRHIKDIASPVAAALAKHARKREKRAKEGKSVLVGEGKEGPIRDFTRATRLHHPTVLMPVKTHGQSATSPGAASPAAAEGEKGASTDKGKDGGTEENGGSAAPGEGYAIAIYPYLADREDEFDVAVGDTFAILNKTKGWWVVHRDTGTGAENDVVRSGWVPQGCLLEITALPSSTGTTPIPTSVPINPLSIVSVSAPGVALMDYAPRGSDELSMKKDDKLLVFKRYQFWSYVIKEATGERGWTPSWFVGKVASSAPSPSPLSAAVTGPNANASQTSTPTSALATGVSTTSSNGSGSTSMGMHTASLSAATTQHSAFGSSSVNAPPSTAYTTASSGAGDTTPTSAATFASSKAYEV